MFKIRSLSSWAGVVFLILFLFSLWYFLLYSKRSSGEVLLPQKPCATEVERKKNTVGDWQLFYYQTGCQSIASGVPVVAAGWLEKDTELISNNFSLPPLQGESAILLSPDYIWKTYTSSTSAPAIETLGNLTPTSRFYLDSALVDLGLEETFPLLKSRIALRQKIAATLALDLEHNAYISENPPLTLTPQEILSLLERCQNNACLAPLRSER